MAKRQISDTQKFDCITELKSVETAKLSVKDIQSHLLARFGVTVSDSTIHNWAVRYQFPINKRPSYKDAAKSFKEELEQCKENQRIIALRLLEVFEDLDIKTCDKLKAIAGANE